MRLIIRLAAVLFALALVVVAATGFLLWDFGRAGPLTADRVVTIERGDGLSTIAARLEGEGVIDSAWLFTAAIYLSADPGAMRFGDYAIPARASGRDAFDIIASGRTVPLEITIPEGLTSQQIVERLLADERLSGDITTVPPEGALLPETYFIDRGSARQALIDRMAAAMDATLAELWVARADGLPLATPEEALILASIIEKETAQADERDLVASVFVNRLNRGMPLQTDPTVIYALTEGSGSLGRPLLRSDLEIDSPYNTYRIDGLPPGPIANPGRAAIAAALNPAQSDFLYFVADGTGGHAFARTLDEHNRNAAEWRRIRDGEADGAGE
ncbi:MAG: endolytic transglycosylase MltG [Azospirillaceae bacterium]